MTRRACGAAHLQHLLQLFQELRGRCSVATRCKEPGVVQGGVPPSRHAIRQPLPKGGNSQSHLSLDSNMPIILRQVSYYQQQMRRKAGQALRRHLSIPHGVGILQPCCNKSEQSSSRQEVIAQCTSLERMRSNKRPPKEFRMSPSTSRAQSSGSPSEIPSSPMPTLACISQLVNDGPCRVRHISLIMLHHLCCTSETWQIRISEVAQTEGATVHGNICWARI